MLSGWLAAWLIQRRCDVTKTRRRLAYFGCFGYFGGAGMLLLSPSIADPVLGMIAMGLASFVLDLTLAGSWGACMDVGGKYAGRLSGSMNMAGNIAGGVAPVAVGYILKYSGHNWMITFWISAAIYVIGGLCWRWIDPVTPLDDAAGAQSS